MAEYLFVCGTLLPELAPDHLKDLMRSLKPRGAASVRGRLYDLGDYPGAVLDEGAETRVQGQVFELPADPEALTALDDYECVDVNDRSASLFVRGRTEAALANGEKLSCWIYTYNQDVSGKPLVPDGDYFNYVASRATDVDDE